MMYDYKCCLTGIGNTLNPLQIVRSFSVVIRWATRHHLHPYSAWLPQLNGSLSQTVCAAAIE